MTTRHFSNAHLQRVEQLNEQIKVIEIMINKGTHIGAGLSIGLNVGPIKEDCGYALEVEVGMTCDTQTILELIHVGLTKTRKLRLEMAQKDLEELQGELMRMGLAGGLR